jgi:ribosomal protein L35
MKTNKSFMKRLRVTKKGKVLARAPGQNHFNAKRSGRELQRHHRIGDFNAVVDNTAKSRYLTK